MIKFKQLKQKEMASDDLEWQVDLTQIYKTQFNEIVFEQVQKESLDKKITNVTTGQLVQQKKERKQYQRTGLLFATPWSPICGIIAQLIDFLRKELNISEPNGDFIDFIIIPANEYETDEQGFQILSKLSGGSFCIPLKDRVLIDQILKSFHIREFPQLFILDKEGDVISFNGIEEATKVSHLKDLKKAWLG